MNSMFKPINISTKLACSRVSRIPQPRLFLCLGAFALAGAAQGCGSNPSSKLPDNEANTSLPEPEVSSPKGTADKNGIDKEARPAPTQNANQKESNPDQKVETEKAIAIMENWKGKTVVFKFRGASAAINGVQVNMFQNTCVFFNPDGNGCSWTKTLSGLNGISTDEVRSKPHCGIAMVEDTTSAAKPIVGALRAVDEKQNINTISCRGNCTYIRNFPLPSNPTMNAFRYVEPGTSYVVEVEIQPGNAGCKGVEPSYPPGASGKI